MIEAFVVFTGRTLRPTQREAMRAMLVDLTQQAAEVRLTASTSFVDAARLAEVLYKHIEDAHAREVTMMLEEAGLEGEALSTWLEQKQLEERSPKKRR